VLKIKSYFNFNKPHNFFHIQKFITKMVTKAEYWHMLMLHFYVYRIIILSDLITIVGAFLLCIWVISGLGYMKVTYGPAGQSSGTIVTL
jgi:hypothetical protein